MPLDQIVPASRNPKGHALAEIRASMDRFGFLEPLLMDERTGRLVGGHGRLETLADAEAAGLDRPEGVEVVSGSWFVPVTRGWSSTDDLEAEAALVALNHLTELGGWNNQDLSTMLADLRAGPGLVGTGYTSQSLDVLLASLKQADEPEPDAASIQPPTRPFTKRGDVWQVGPHRIMCGDCRSTPDVTRLIAGAEIHLAFTSPPYAEQRTYDPESGFAPIPPDEYVDWFELVAGHVADVLAPDGSWFVNIKAPADGLDTDLYVLDLVVAHVRRWGWHFATELCWERPGVPKQVSRRFKNAFEPIYQFARGEWKMRPEAVRTFSENVPINVGPGGGQTSWHDDQGSGIAMGVRPARKGRVTRNGVDAPDVRHTQTGPERSTVKKRKNGVAGAAGGETHQGQGPYGHGEYTMTGLAYPSNRLPTFTGSHDAVGHTAAFPVGLPEWFVKAYTDPDDRVYDPFAGSGSTILAAHNQHRTGFGMELSPRYVDVICKRLQAHTDIVPVLERTGRPHNFT